MLCAMANSALFDLGEEIELVAESPDRLGIEPQDAFYLCRACGVLAAICSVFEVERIEKGCVITAYGRLCLHEITIREGGFVSLGAQANDHAASVSENFHVGYAYLPETWEGVIRSIFKTERAILQMVDFAGRMKAEWEEFLRVRKDRLGF